MTLDELWKLYRTFVEEATTTANYHGDPHSAVAFLRWLATKRS